MPGVEKVAVVSTRLASPNMTVPGPLTLLHTVVTTLGGFGRPSSVTVPSKTAVSGWVIILSNPAYTLGALLPVSGAYNSNTRPSFSFGSLLLSMPRSAT